MKTVTTSRQDLRTAYKALTEALKEGNTGETERLSEYLENKTLQAQQMPRQALAAPTHRTSLRRAAPSLQ